MEYEIRQLLFESNEDFNQMLQLQSIVYPGRVFSISGFKRWYVENPMGKVISFNAFYGDEMVAHYACVPIKMNIDGSIVDGLLDMATVTHPDHRGKGLFKTLAKTTYDFAAENGYEFIIGVANGNSFPGYMKYFNFTFVSRLDVKWSFGKSRYEIPSKTFSMYWTQETLQWRLGREKYTVSKNRAYARHGNVPLFKSIMGVFNFEIKNLPKSRHFLRPFNLYVGLGVNTSGFHNFPSFIKHSPFNLIFLDLTGGKLPKINKDNIFFQLVDFDAE